MVGVPTYDKLMNPTLVALRKLGGSASTAELLEQVVEDLQPAQEVIEQHPGRSNQTELGYRLAWARTYLKKYGLITNSARGVWALTPAGHDLEAVDPRIVVRFVRDQSRRELEGRTEAAISDERRTERETSEVETASWRETLIATLLEMPPDAFERLCQRLLRESGFIQVEVTGRSGDGGIDGHGIVRLAGLISFPVIFQCKRYRNTISSSVVRDFRGAMVGRADKGLIITTGSFTRDAGLEATRDGAPPIDLIDGEQLIDKLKDLELGVVTRRVEVVEVNTQWFDSI